MDGSGNKPRGGKKPARAADAATHQPVALDTPPALSSDDTAAAVAGQQVDVGQPDVASVDESRGGGGAEEEDDHDNDDDEDKQVERFYALLANIRAMRGLPVPPHNHNMVVASSSSCCAGGGDNDTDAAGDSTRKKRLRRSAEPPWRPAFRMEDFEEPPPLASAASSSSSCKLRKRTTTGAGHDGHGESSGSAPVVVDAARGGTVRFQQSD